MPHAPSAISSATPSATRPIGLLALLFALLLSLPVSMTTPVAQADTAPPAGAPAQTTVSADPLPTVQIDGVAWAQVIVGTTVFVTGNFGYARPAGEALTSPNRVARSNLLAYDLTTGTLIPGFDHSLNAQGRALAASPDGRTVYLGGNFTTVDGQPHDHLAAFDVASGTLIDSFAPDLNNTVLAVTATAGTVYAGGLFNTANQVGRARLAAFTTPGSATAGQLTGWNPGADATVTAMVIAPDQSRVVIGGSFASLAGAARYGIGAVYTNGSSAPWAANFPVRNNGLQSAVDALTVSGSYVYGGGYAFMNDGNFEGRFAVDPTTGTARWLNSCHGDTYSVAVLNSVLYSASHEHDCSDIGSFSQDQITNTTASRHFLAAETLTVSGTIRPPMYDGGPGLGGNPNYASFSGQPHTTQLDWYPTLTAGTVSDARQAAWTTVAGAGYLAVGGEFPTANGVGQQGLVRYAISSIAPNKVGPSALSAPTVTRLPALTAGGTARWGDHAATGRLRVSWTAAWDQDNARLSYAVYRDGLSRPLFRTTDDSSFDRRRTLGFVDTGLIPGSLHSYRVVVTDPYGNASNSPYAPAVTVDASVLPSYPALVERDGAVESWRLNEADGTIVRSSAGRTDLNLGTGVQLGTPGPIDGAGTAATFGGDFHPFTSSGKSPIVTYHSDAIAVARTVSAPASTYSLEAWVKTTSTDGGVVLADGALPPSGSTSYGQPGQISPVIDRVLYFTTTGKAVFGVRHGNTNVVIDSRVVLNDGRWHHLVATTGPGGSSLWTDGVQRNTDTTMTDTDTFWGAWRIGAESLFAWPLTPSSGALAGSIADVAVYPKQLSAAQIVQHAAAG